MSEGLVTAGYAALQVVPVMKDIQGTLASGVVGPFTQAGGSAAAGFGGAFATTLGVGAVVAGAAVAAGAAFYKIGEVFDDVTDTIRIGTGATGEALEGLVDVAKDVGDQVPASFDAIGPVVADLNTRLGLTGDTLTTVASQYLEAGRILEEDVDVQATSAAFSAFKIEGDAVSGAMDHLFRVSQATGVGMNELAGAAQAMAPTMQTLGFSFEETTSLVGSLDKAGLNAQQVMAGMQRGLVNLARDGEEPADAFRRVTGELEGFIASGDTAAAIDLASTIFGTRGAVQMVGAIQSGTLALEDLVGAAGLTGDTILGVGQDTMDAAEKWDILKNRALTALEPIGSAIFGIAGDLLSAFMDSGALDSVLGWVSSIGEGLAGVDIAGMLSGLDVGGLMALLNPLGTLLKDVLLPILPTIGDAFMQVGSAIGTALLAVLPALSPLLGAIVDALIVVAPILGDVASLVAGALSGAFTQIAPVLVEVVGILAGAVAEILPQLTPLLEVAATVVGALLDAVTPLIEPLLGVVEALLPLVEVAGELIAAILPPLSELLMAILPPIADLVGILVDLLVPVVEWLGEVLGVIVGVITTVIEQFIGLIDGSVSLGEAWSVVWQAVQDAFMSIWGGVIDWIKGVWETILGNARDAWNGLVDWVQALPGRIIDALVELNGKVLTFVIEAVIGIKDSAVAKFTELVDWVKGLPDLIVDALGDLADLLVNAGKDIMTGLLDGLTDAWEDVQDFVGGVGDWISDHKGPKAYDLALLRPAGGWIMTGLRESMEDEIPALERTLQRVSGVIAGGVGATAGVGTPGRGGNVSGSTTKVLNYYAADGTSIGSEEDLWDAANRARMVGW